MKRNRQNTALDRSAEHVQQSSKHGISRRKFVQTSAGIVAAGALLGKRAFAAPGPLKIGYVSPETGAIATFGESDAFIIDEIRKIVQGGIQSGGATRQVEIIVRDSQSSPSRAAEVAAELIKSDKVDLMAVAGGSENVIPVIDQCEVNQVPCVSTDNPWQPTMLGRGKTPAKGWDWVYHFFWGTDQLSQVKADLFSLVPTNKVVGMLLGDDPVGNAEADRVHGVPPVYEARGFKVFDPGRFITSTTDFSAQISAFKNAHAEILDGNMSLPSFSNFWSQAAQQGYKPKIGCMSKALLMPFAVDSLGPLGKDLSTEVWWTNHHPFKSSLTGQSALQLCDTYEEVTKKQWMQALGFRHALFEVVLDVFKRAQNSESAASVIEAVRTTTLNTMVGPVQWLGTLPNQWTKIPVKNVCTTPLVGGQWVPGKKWMYDLAVTTNDEYPLIPVQRKMEPLPA
jgi:branched-chain amino acid transport system substrate-binding protein